MMVEEEQKKRTISISFNLFTYIYQLYYLVFIYLYLYLYISHSHCVFSTLLHVICIFLDTIVIGTLKDYFLDRSKVRQPLPGTVEV